MGSAAVLASPGAAIRTGRALARGRRSRAPAVMMFWRKKSFEAPVVMGDEEIMCKKAHGTSEKPVQPDLRWGCDVKKADEICSFNRHYAEHSGYFKRTSWTGDILAKSDGPTEYYDSVTGKLLFTAPIGRSTEDFIRESAAHGWPSFR